MMLEHAGSIGYSRQERIVIHPESLSAAGAGDIFFQTENILRRMELLILKSKNGKSGNGQEEIYSIAVTTSEGEDSSVLSVDPSDKRGDMIFLENAYQALKARLQRAYLKPQDAQVLLELLKIWSKFS